MEQEGNTKVADLELIRLYLKTKDASLFSALYKRYAGKVYGKCLSLLKDEHLARDATQEIFLKIFLNLSRFEANSKFSTWVYSITYNYCIDLLRKQNKVRNLFDDEADRLPEVEAEEVPDEALLAMEVDRLRIVLEHIPVDDKAILLMKYQDGMQIKEIAELLQKSESAVKMRIMRAKAKAHKAYKSLFPEL